MMDKKTLLNQVQQYHFMMVEAGLFLDTHCGCKEAEVTFMEYQKLYEKTKNEYESCYGPLTYEGVNINEDGWSWVQTPWPWEVERC